VLFDAYEQTAGAHFVFSLPAIAFEAAIMNYTIWTGFRRSPILDDSRYGRVVEGSVAPVP
jgi:hypothetical protein